MLDVYISRNDGWILTYRHVRCVSRVTLQQGGKASQVSKGGFAPIAEGAFGIGPVGHSESD